MDRVMKENEQDSQKQTLNRKKEIKVGQKMRIKLIESLFFCMKLLS